MEQKSLKKNAFYSVLRVFLNLVFPLITFPYASRILSPEGIGKVNFSNTIMTYFILLGGLGIGGYATRETVKIRSDKNTLSKFFKEIISINLICCAIAYFLFFISLFTIPKLHNYQSLLLALSINIFFSVVSIEWIYIAHEDFKYLTIRSFIVQLVSLIYLFVFVHTKDDLIQYAFFGIIINTVNNVINYFTVGKYIDFKYKSQLELKKHLKPLFIFFGITVVTSIYTMFDTSMLGFLSNDIEVGYYTASTKLGHMVLSMLTAITTVLLPRLTDYAHNNDKERFTALAEKCLNILLLLSIPMTTGLILLSKPIILLLSGEQYLPSVPSMQIISLIIILTSLGSLIGAQILPSLGKEKISFYSYIAGAITNITLNAILIPKLGSLGAAIGTVCAEFIVTLIQCIYVRKLFSNKDYLITILESILASTVMGVSIIFLSKISSHPIYQILISFLGGVIIYSLILFLLRNKYLLFYTNKLFHSKKTIFNRNIS